jgi:predicted ester cyclase
MKKLYVLALAGLFLTSCGKKEEGGAAANPAADSMKAAYTAVIGMFNSGDPAGVENYIAADSKDHQQMPGYEGLEGFKKMVVEWKAAMPDSKYTVEDMRVDGDVLVARVKYSGTNTGPMMGMPATNKAVSDIIFIDWVRWHNGKFVEHWGMGEDMKMMTQLGLIPDMHSGAPPADTSKKAM